MQRIEMVYSEERGTWNLFVDNEWYYEGDYDLVLKMADTFWFSDEEEY